MKKVRQKSKAGRKRKGHDEVSMYRRIMDAVRDEVMRRKRPLDLHADVLPVVAEFMWDEWEAEMVDYFLVKTLMSPRSGVVIYPYPHGDRIRWAVTSDTRIWDCLSGRVETPVDWWSEKKPRSRA